MKFPRGLLLLVFLPTLLTAWYFLRTPCSDNVVDKQKGETLHLAAKTVPDLLDVECTRSFYCPSNASKEMSISMPSHILLHHLEKEIFDNHFLNIQYWGDSVQAQMECDMRQWLHDHNMTMQREEHVRNTESVARIFYHAIGAPWDKKLNKLNSLAKNSLLADVIIFNIGSHYENNAEQRMFEDHLRQFRPILQSVVDRGNLVIIRSPSATHFQTPDGLFRGHQPSCQPRQQQPRQQGQSPFNGNRNSTDIIVVSMPDLHHQQATMLRALADSIGATYLDIYAISDDYSLHAQSNHGTATNGDCRHFCQNSNMMRSWNLLAAASIYGWIHDELDELDDEQ